MSKRKDMERDIDGLLMAMIISDLFGDTIVSDNMDKKEIIGLKLDEDEYGVGIEPIIFDETLLNPPKKSNKLESEK
jgi:hypothetical protein